MRAHEGYARQVGGEQNEPRPAGRVAHCMDLLPSAGKQEAQMSIARDAQMQRVRPEFHGQN